MEAHNSSADITIAVSHDKTSARKNFQFPNVNHITIAGRLEADPPLRYTKRGIPVTNFIISTIPEPGAETFDGSQRKPCYVSVVVWSQQAVQCNKYLHKGSSVLIIGELQSMPNCDPESGFLPIQINAQWIQYLDKGSWSGESYVGQEFKE